MTAAVASDIAHRIEVLASPLPPLPAGEALSEDQWKVLFAIGDAIVGNVSTSQSKDTINVSSQEYNTIRQTLVDNLPKGVDDSAVDRYLAETASNTPEIRTAMNRLILNSLRADARDSIRMILSTLK